MSDCVYRMKRGWYCSRRRWHTGPCALRPRWYNVIDRFLYWGY